MSESAYDPAAVEAKWQGHWDQNKTFAVRDDLPREQCYYVLEMFPYPSGRLHMGHVRNYSIGDAIARYKRMNGFHVLHPMGWDSFGLPAEQAAIDRGEHPKKWTYENIAHMRDQLKRMGFSYDWEREFATSDPEYSRREQELFLDLVDKGLVYRKSSMVNWSTGLNTVLANEQVVDGKCWRTDTPVIQKELPQWFMRTTAYSEELLNEIDGLTQWPDAVKTMQRNWIGRSVGAEIDFKIKGHDDQITVFTTRPDTIFGVTFMSLAPEHALVDKIVSDEQRATIEAFRNELQSQSEEERTGDKAEKKGVFTGAYAINPVNGDEVPIYAANFVLADYGTGAVMAVPGHDSRDFAFAKAYELPIKKVILADGSDADAALEEAFTEVGTLINSASFDGQRSDEAKENITKWFEDQGFGRQKITWRLRDWGISRQRYWGNPIPYVYGEEMGAVPLRKQDLPVSLPEDVVFDGIGNPIEKHPTWASTANDGSELKVQMQSGYEPARRETDTADTFLQSSWYFARYTCPDEEGPLDKKRVDHWLPVDLYVGGIEHACMHLLYARFFQKALADVGYADVREPFKRLLCQGMVVKETYYREVENENAQVKKVYYSPKEVTVEKDDKGRVTKATLNSDNKPVVVGRIEKMSKSKNNGVDPQELIEQYGADTARLFSLFAAPPEKDLDWNEAGVAGCYRFLRRLWDLVAKNAEVWKADAFTGKAKEAPSKADTALIRTMHNSIKRATHAMEKDFSFNVAIAECMTLFNDLKPDQLDAGVCKTALIALLSVLNPMAPHIASELLTLIGEDAEAASWPSFDESELIADETEYPLQVKGKVKAKISLPSGLDKNALEEAVKAHPEYKAIVGDAEPRKLIVVPGKIINVVP